MRKFVAIVMFCITLVCVGLYSNVERRFSEHNGSIKISDYTLAENSITQDEIRWYLLEGKDVYLEGNKITEEEVTEPVYLVTEVTAQYVMLCACR